MYIDNPEISRYYELYVNIVQCHVQAYLMHILSFIVQNKAVEVYQCLSFYSEVRLRTAACIGQIIQPKAFIWRTVSRAVFFRLVGSFLKEQSWKRHEYLRTPLQFSLHASWVFVSYWGLKVKKTKNKKQNELYQQEVFSVESSSLHQPPLFNRKVRIYVSNGKIWQHVWATQKQKKNKVEEFQE